MDHEGPCNHDDILDDVLDIDDIDPDLDEARADYSAEEVNRKGERPDGTNEANV